MHPNRRTARVGAVVIGLGGLACNLEAALGVDDDGSGADTSQVSPGTASGAPSPAGSTTEEGGGPSGGADEADSTTAPLDPSACSGRPLRVATFNVKGVSSPGSPSHEALADIIRRVDADVVCLQEVLFYETDELFTLASETGYPRVIQGNEPPAIGGDFTNACLSRGSLTLEGSYGGRDLSDDFDANDVGRDILVVRADLAAAGEPSCAVGVVALHLKSGQDPLDWFRRQVEAERVEQAVARYRAAHPGEPMIILGDLNESLDDPALGSVFPEVPAGLPGSYQVGSDIEFPLTYHPFDTFVSLGFSIADATQEDSTRSYETWSDAVRLDYVLYAGLELQADEVYNACRDNGVDDAPAGNWVAKAGDSLPCSVSELASDHFPVLTDLVMP